jgi:hypothetical protein
MRILLALVGAYLIVGPIYVRRKLTMRDSSFLKIPPILMRYQIEGGIGRLIIATLSWPLATFLNREFGYWVGFVIAAILLYLSSI